MTTEQKTSWYDKKGWVVFWFIFFFPLVYMA
jgi:hypothetical protein